MRRLIATIPLLLCLSVCCPSLGHAESLDSIFQGANNSFWNGDYAAAKQQYKRLEELGVKDANLAYNRATTHARLGELGMAVLYYERTLRLDPGHPDAFQNMTIIREFIARKASENGQDADIAPKVTPFRAILDKFSSTSAPIGFLWAHVLLFSVLIVRYFVSKEFPRLILGVASGVLGIVAALMLVITIGKGYQDAYTKEAIVTQSGLLDIMEGPSSDIKRFAIGEGSRVRILEVRDNALHIQDGQGRDGWARQKGLQAI